MSDSTPRRTLLRPRWIVVLLLTVVAAVALLRSRAAEPVDTIGLDRRDIVETLAVVGRVRAPARAALGSAIAGTVEAVHVREGDHVLRGAVLVSLESREAAASVRQAEATLAEVVATTRQATEEADREARQSELDLGRLRAVVDEGGLTRQRLEQAEQRAADAASRANALRALAPGGADEPAAVTRARATLEGARARLALTRITAPSAGVVLSRTVEPGDAVSPGRIVLEFAFDGPAELVVFPAEENLHRLKLGAPAVASADAFAEQRFAATVSLIAPTVDPAQGTVEVRLAIDDPPPYLVPEMTVSVNIETGRRSGAAVLPEESVQGLGTGTPWVGIVQDGRIERRDVVVGLRADRSIEILSGLDGTETIVRSTNTGELGRRVRVVDAGG